MVQCVKSLTGEPYLTGTTAIRDLRIAFTIYDSRLFVYTTRSLLRRYFESIDPSANGSRILRLPSRRTENRFLRVEHDFPMKICAP